MLYAAEEPAILGFFSFLVVRWHLVRLAVPVDDRALSLTVSESSLRLSRGIN